MNTILNYGMKFLLALFVGLTAISCSNNNDSILEPQPEENPLPDEDITSWTFCVEGNAVELYGETIVALGTELNIINNQ